MTVRMAMSHRAGLASLDRDFTLGEVLAWEPVIRGIEVQRPHHPPGAGHMYHALTYGWIVGEIIHRVTGMLPGEYFRRTLGDPLELRTWIGLPESERNSVAWMEPPLPDEESEAARQAAWVRARRGVCALVRCQAARLATTTRAAGVLRTHSTADSRKPTVAAVPTVWWRIRKRLPIKSHAQRGMSVSGWLRGGWVVLAGSPGPAREVAGRGLPVSCCGTGR